MVSRKPQMPPEPRHTELAPKHIRSSIPKLERRLFALRAFDPRTLSRRGDPTIDALEKTLQGTLDDVPRVGTVEAKRFQSRQFDAASWNACGPTPIGGGHRVS